MYSGEADEVATKRIEPASDGGMGGVQADRVLHLSPTNHQLRWGRIVIYQSGPDVNWVEAKQVGSKV